MIQRVLKVTILSDIEDLDTWEDILGTIDQTIEDTVAEYCQPGHYKTSVEVEPHRCEVCGHPMSPRFGGACDECESERIRINMRQMRQVRGW